MSLGGTFAVLNEMVHSKVVEAYAIAGAVAAYNYIEPTVSDDLDVLVSLKPPAGRAAMTTKPIWAFLQQRGYTDFQHEGVVVEGWAVQFLPVANPLDEEALRCAQTINVTHSSTLIPIRVLRPEHLVANALRTRRPLDTTRIIQFLDEKAVDPIRLCSLLSRHGLTGLWDRFVKRMDLDDPCKVTSFGKPGLA